MTRPSLASTDRPLSRWRRLILAGESAFLIIGAAFGLLQPLPEQVIVGGLQIAIDLRSLAQPILVSSLVQMVCGIGLLALWWRRPPRRLFRWIYWGLGAICLLAAIPVLAGFLDASVQARLLLPIPPESLLSSPQDS